MIKDGIVGDGAIQLTGGGSGSTYNRSKRSTGRTITVAPPTSTSSG